ncbi:LysR family transcriptional regulator [Sorangium sp. So ce375]|uniref:LysR family transcriptional regulator n=1 Tax=Sorangium sp. So ce375 TaxID=3133306 RepID=UPI003F5B52D4
MPIKKDVYGRDLDLNLLRVFTVVAEEGSLTRAASRLYVTQPAVSASMRRLAAFVGAELVVRHGQGVALTARGSELLAATRAHLQPLVAAAAAPARFEPARSTATIRFGLADGLAAAILPALLARLRAEAPRMQLIVVEVQFRNVGDLLLSSKVDFAVAVADDLPGSILRQPLGSRREGPSGFVCLHDARFVSLPDPLTERAYFAQEHVIVSYAGDTRGIVEDELGKTRTARVSVPSFAYLADIVDGSSLVATTPALFARCVVEARRHLRAIAVPFSLQSAPIELLWTRMTDDHAAARFVRGLVCDVLTSCDAPDPRARRSRRA